jgi:hypothetical protein
VAHGFPALEVNALFPGLFLLIKKNPLEQTHFTSSLITRKQSNQPAASLRDRQRLFPPDLSQCILSTKAMALIFESHQWRT